MMPNFRKLLLLAAGLITTTVLSAPAAMASDNFLTSYSSSKWHGGSVDNDGDGVADFCIMLPKRPDEQVLLLLDTTDGVLLGLINPAWQIDDVGGHIDVDVVVPGHWNSGFTAQITDTDTIAVKLGAMFEAIEAVKAGSELFAYHYIGDFEVSLSGTRDAMNTVQRCFRDEIVPHLKTDVTPVPPIAPSKTYQDGKTAFDAKEYLSALGIWQQAAANGDARAMNSIGLLHRSGLGVPKNYQAAMYWFEQAAEQGLDAAQFNLGQLYDKGNGTDVNYHEALAWYRKSAAQGYDPAQLYMGIKYLKGQGVAKDVEAARQWYLLAAQNGNRAAQFNLATMLRRGSGGAPDPEQAVYWYRRSAEQGHAFAQLRLGDALSQGLGGRTNLAEAYKWYLLASKAGKDEATERLAEFQSIVSQAEQQHVSRLAEQWSPTPEPRGKSLVAQPVPRQAVQPPTEKPKAIVTKKLPDDLFAVPEAKPEQPIPLPTPVPAADVQGDIRVEGCYDRSQAASTCQATCTSPAFAEEFAGSVLVRKKGLQAPVQYCINGCQQAEDEFTQALNNVAVLKGSKFFCPMLYAETAQLAQDNQIPREYGDKSARKTHATGSDTYNETTRLEATPEQLAALSRAPYSPGVQALVDQMPAVLEGCYDTASSAAMDYCRADCIEDAKFPGNSLTSEQALELCNTGCDLAVDLFKDQAIWLQAKNEDGMEGTFCSAVRFTDIAREEVRNTALVDGITRNAAGKIVGGVAAYWKGALIAGGY